MPVSVFNGNFFEKTFGASLLVWCVSKIGLNTEKELQSKNLLALSDKQKIVLTEAHKFSTKSLSLHLGGFAGLFALEAVIYVRYHLRK